MSINTQVSEQASILPINLSGDFLFALEKFCAVYGGKAATQGAMKALQAIPIVWSALAVKEGDKMTGAARNKAASKCMQEVAVPGFIKLIEQAITESQGKLVMPASWKEQMYYTTLGKGQKSKKKTFMQSEVTVFNKFKAIKGDFTKSFNWFNENEVEPSQLPSGTNTQDALGRLNDDMYRQKREEEKSSVDLSSGGGTDSDGGPVPSDSENPRGQTSPPSSARSEVSGEDAPSPAAAVVSAPATPPAASRAATSTALTTPITTPASLAAEAAAATRREESVQREESVPDDWFFPYLLLAAAFSPWSGQCPSEWRYLESSSGPKKRKQVPQEAITLDGDSPMCNAHAMTRLNPNGDSVSRRQHYAAINREKDANRKAEMEKENKAERRELIDSSKQRLVVLGTATASVQEIGRNLQEMVRLNQARAAAQERLNQARVAEEKRENRIKALERKLVLRLGDEQQVRAELERLLDEC